VIEGVLAAAGVPIPFITPPAWKRAVGLTLKSKDAARSEAIRRWPDHAALFARVKDACRSLRPNARAEALMPGAKSVCWSVPERARLTLFQDPAKRPTELVCAVSFVPSPMRKNDPLGVPTYLPKTSPNASAGIGRPPRRRRTAVPGRTALSRIAIGCPFESNLTALSGE
jgi:hypothetical protein